MAMRRVLLWVSLPVLLSLPLNSGRANDKDDPEPPPTWPKSVPTDRARSATNLKHIGVAMHNFYAVWETLPAAAITDKTGKKLLSWRVILLPYLNEASLYDKFKLDEPWDSKHNKKLLEKMPKVYAPTITGKPAKPHTTYYQVLTGAGTIFDPKLKKGGNPQAGTPIAQVPDGLSNTVLAVEAAEPVLWTKPDDIPYDAKKVPKLGGLFKEGFHLLFADGVVRQVSRKVDAKVLQALITPAGGEEVDVSRLPAPE